VRGGGDGLRGQKTQRNDQHCGEGLAGKKCNAAQTKENAYEIVRVAQPSWEILKKGRGPPRGKNWRTKLPETTSYKKEPKARRGFWPKRKKMANIWGA